MQIRDNKKRIGDHKKRTGYSKKIVMFMLAFLLLGSIVFLWSNKNKRIVALNFSDDIAMFITKDDPVSISEFLIYAASVSQEVSATYGDDIWNQTIEVNKGDYVTYEEYTRQQICEQIKLTHILSTYANTYNVTLTEEELVLLSSDAEEYHKNLSEANSGSVGIDLSLILQVYKENLLAEKVYKKITSNVEKTNEMFQDEYEDACINYFDKIYKKLSKEQVKDWKYITHVNVDKISKIQLARTIEYEKNSAENGVDIILDSLVRMGDTK